MENESPESILWLSVFENRGGNSPGDMETSALAANRAVELFSNRPKQAPAPAPESVSFPGHATVIRPNNSETFSMPEGATLRFDGTVDATTSGPEHFTFIPPTGTEPWWLRIFSELPEEIQTAINSGDLSHAVYLLVNARARLSRRDDRPDHSRALAAAYLAADPDCPANPDGSGEWSIDDVAEAVQLLHEEREYYASEVRRLKERAKSLACELADAHRMRELQTYVEHQGASQDAAAIQAANEIIDELRAERDKLAQEGHRLRFTTPVTLDGRQAVESRRAVANLDRAERAGAQSEIAQTLSRVAQREDLCSILAMVGAPEREQLARGVSRWYSPGAAICQAIAETDLPADMSSADAVRTLWGRLASLQGECDKLESAIQRAGLPSGISLQEAREHMDWCRKVTDRGDCDKLKAKLSVANEKAGAYDEIREALGFVDETPAPAEVVALARKASDALTDAASDGTPGPAANVKLRAGLTWALSTLEQQCPRLSTNARRIIATHEALLVQLAGAEPDTDWAKVCASVGLVEGCSADRVIECIDEMKREMDEANETLAAYCPEGDPSRCSLSDTVNLFVMDVLEPLRKRTPTVVPGSLNAAALVVADSLRAIAHDTIGIGYRRQALDLIDGARALLRGADAENYAGHYAWAEMRSASEHAHHTVSSVIGSVAVESAATILVVEWCLGVLRGAR